MTLTKLILLAIASVATLWASDYWLDTYAHIPADCRLGAPTFRTAAQINEILDKLDGKSHGYVVFLWTFDLVAPLLYGASLYVAISLGAWPGLRWIAIIAAISDYIENALTTGLLVAYPAKFSFLATLCAVATLVKWALYGGALAIAVIAGIALKVR